MMNTLSDAPSASKPQAKPAPQPSALSLRAPAPSFEAAPLEEDFSDLYPANPFYQPESSGSLGGFFDSIADPLLNLERPQAPPPRRRLAP